MKHGQQRLLCNPGSPLKYFLSSIKNCTDQLTCSTLAFYVVLHCRNWATLKVSFKKDTHFVPRHLFSISFSAGSFLHSFEHTELCTNTCNEVWPVHENKGKYRTGTLGQRERERVRQNGLDTTSVRVI